MLIKANLKKKNVHFKAFMGVAIYLKSCEII